MNETRAILLSAILAGAAPAQEPAPAKPRYAYATMTRLLNDLSIERPLDLGEGVVAHRFSAAGRPAVTCLWSLDGDRTATVPGEKPLVRTDLMGGTERLAPEGGRIRVPLRAEVPLFLEERP